MLIYSNSCSFGISVPHELTYPEILATRFNAKLINEGMPGSCNRRIIRSSLRSIIEIRKKQKKPILALIGLSYIFRTELWQPHLLSSDNDGDFHSILNKKIMELDWSSGFFTNKNNNVHEFANKEVKDYYKQWLLQYNEEAVITDLVTDLIMFIECVKALNVNILIFSNCQRFPSSPNVDLNAPFLNSLYNNLICKKEIIDPWNFCFAEYALSRNHLPRDYDKFGLSGHPNENAHIDFAEFIYNQLLTVYPSLCSKKEE